MRGDESGPRCSWKRRLSIPKEGPLQVQPQDTLTTQSPPQICACSALPDMTIQTYTDGELNVMQANSRPNFWLLKALFTVNKAEGRSACLLPDTPSTLEAAIWVHPM